MQPPGGSGNLWDLVSVVNGQDDSLLPASYSKGVMHMKHLLKFKTVSTPYSLESPMKSSLYVTGLICQVFWILQAKEEMLIILGHRNCFIYNSCINKFKVK